MSNEATIAKIIKKAGRYSLGTRILKKAKVGIVLISPMLARTNPRACIAAGTGKSMRYIIDVVRANNAPPGAGTPMKQFLYFGAEEENLARRKDMQITKNKANNHPNLYQSFKYVKYTKIAGAIPKFAKSARLSSVAPNSLSLLSNLASLPSRASKQAEKKIHSTAFSICPLIVNLIDHNPRQRASSVIPLGITLNHLGGIDSV